MKNTILDMNDFVPLNIDRIIHEKGLKQCAVAQRAGLNVAEFSSMLNGRKLIKLSNIRPIADALGVTPNDLFAIAGEE